MTAIFSFLLLLLPLLMDLRRNGKSRVKREDCHYTKHDHLFSKWEILIGPSDWENYSMGKDGSERYRIHNLPKNSSCPGIYELGIVTSHTSDGRIIRRKTDPRRIIVVYLGQADNVRTRLQHYGRGGSHLEQGVSLSLENNRTNATAPLENLCSQQGLSLFREIFSRGFPLVFRWAPMKNKKEAEEKEADLLSFFDYAWNKGGNGARRPDDIHYKLDKIQKGQTKRDRLLSALERWKVNVLGTKRVGIRIKTKLFYGIKPEPTSSGCYDNKVSILKFSRPSVVSQIKTENVHDDASRAVCGVALGDGSVCYEVPVHGRKRCDKHKGMRINGYQKQSTEKNKVLLLKDGLFVCGFVMQDGSSCMEKPVCGRKRCAEHKGRRVCFSTLKTFRDQDVST